MSIYLTSAEDAELLRGRHKVEVSGEEIHEGAGIHHEHEHAEAVHSHLLPAKRRKSEKDRTHQVIKRRRFSQMQSYLSLLFK